MYDSDHLQGQAGRQAGRLRKVQTSRQAPQGADKQAGRLAGSWQAGALLAYSQRGHLAQVIINAIQHMRKRLHDIAVLL